MGDAVFVAEFDFRRGSRFGFTENGIDALLRVGIQHEELTSMRAGVTKKLEPVGFWAGQGVLVPEHDAGGIVLQLAGPDETAASAAFAGAWDGVFLGIGVEGGRGILDDNVTADPLLQRGGGASIDVILRRIVRERAALFDGDQVVRVGSVIALLHGRRNFVVWLRKDAIETNARGIETEGAKGLNLGHGISGSV